MADAFVGMTGNAAVFHVTALDLFVRWYLARTAIFRPIVDTHPVDPNHNYKAITLTVHGELAPDLTIPSETVTPDSVDIPATRQVTVTMDEHMKVMKHTLLGDVTSWNKTLPQDLVVMLTNWTRDTMDLSVRTALDAGTNVFYPLAAGGFQVADPGDATRGPLTAKAIAAAKANLRTRRAVPKNGSQFYAVIHPDVAFDLFAEGGPGGGTWSYNTQNAYTNSGEIRQGTVTSYAGVDFAESEQCTTATPTSDRVYTSYFVGQGAVLEAVKIEPHVFDGPVVDPAKRILPVVSHGLYGHTIFRNNAIQLVKSESSLGAIAVNPGTYDPKA